MTPELHWFLFVASALVLGLFWIKALLGALGALTLWVTVPAAEIPPPTRLVLILGFLISMAIVVGITVGVFLLPPEAFPWK